MAEPIMQVFWHLTELVHSLRGEHFGINEVAAGLFSVQLAYHGVTWSRDVTHKVTKAVRAKHRSRKAKKLEKTATSM